MKNFWNGLSTFWKVFLVAFVLIVAIFIWDRVTGGISDIKGYFNDKAYAERMEKDAQYEKTIAELKAKNVELDKKIVESETKAAILEENDKALTQKTKDELAKLDVLLAEQDAEEARTNEPTDGYTRCTRTKEKMLAMKPPIKAAQDIDCNVYIQNNQ